MNDRVRALSIRVRAPRTGADLESASTRFMTDVLARVADRVRAEHGDRPVFVRDLKLDLRMLEGALSITDEVAAVAARVEAHIEELVAVAAQTAPAPEHEVAVFASVAAWRAAFVIGAPGGRDAWYFKDLAGSTEPAELLGLPDARLARATIAALCDRTPDFERALLRLDVPELTTWIRTLRAIEAEISGAKDGAEREEPLHPRADRLVTMVIHAARAIAGSATPATPTTASPVTREDAPRDAPGDVGHDQIATEELARTGRQPARDGTPDRSRPARREAPARAFTTAPTRIARAAYLVSIWLELDVGQALFLAGLREGTWFANALASAAGLDAPGGEALCLAVGGEAAHLPVPEIAPRKIDEVSSWVLETWMRSATVRRLDVDLTSTVERWSDGRFLVVRGARCATPICALAANTIEEATASLRRLTDLAPPAATLRGSRALVELDRSRRLSPAVVDGAASGGPAGALLVSMVAGAALEHYALRSGVPGQAIAPSFAVEGSVIEDRELVIVEMDASAIDVPLRVAGLDGSPGFMPWRNKALEIDFTGLETW